MGRKIRDPDAAYWDARLKSEAEDEDFEAFAAAYFEATSKRLVVIDRPEPPDFLCERADGSQVGVELTQIRRSPSDALWTRIVDKLEDMDAVGAWDEFNRLLAQKSAKLPKFPTSDNVLVFLSCEADFSLLVHLLRGIPEEDLKDCGFTEIWVGDYQGIRQGAHFTIRLAGLYPLEVRVFVDRPDHDQKPYG